MITLSDHQLLAIEKLRTGSILVGGVGTGKSRTSIGYYYFKDCQGRAPLNGDNIYKPMKCPKNLYIITTAKKRDTKEWEAELEDFGLSKNRDTNESEIEIYIDSWNNISKYSSVKNSFFIFDEQRVVGNGTWVKSFLKITKTNNWILLSATPGDVWTDYIPVFIANGWYKNRTEFFQRHVVQRYTGRYYKIERYLEVARLIKLRDAVIVQMHYQKKTIPHDEVIKVPFDKEKLNTILVKRWNVYDQCPVRDISEACYLMRKVVNSDPRRLDVVEQIYKKHPRLIIFYNFNYERDILLELGKKLNTPIAQWNGSKHESIPETENWLYIVQYTAGAEGWNCIKTNAILFYSQSYSYKATVQAGGRIDRLNTSYTDLYYYYLRSNSAIDIAIQKALSNKKDFNASIFLK